MLFLFLTAALASAPAPPGAQWIACPTDVQAVNGVPQPTGDWRTGFTAGVSYTGPLSWVAPSLTYDVWSAVRCGFPGQVGPPPVTQTDPATLNCFYGVPQRCGGKAMSASVYRNAPKLSTCEWNGTEQKFLCRPLELRALELATEYTVVPGIELGREAALHTVVDTAFEANGARARTQEFLTVRDSSPRELTFPIPSGHAFQFEVAWMRDQVPSVRLEVGDEEGRRGMDCWMEDAVSQGSIVISHCQTEPIRTGSDSVTLVVMPDLSADETWIGVNLYSAAESPHR